MARHIAGAGHSLVTWNRTPGRADGLPEADSPEQAVDGAQAVVLMLFGPDAVREVLPRVLAGGLAPGALVIDATTIGPDDAREFAAACSSAGARYVEAPVAGSLGPAAHGTLGVLVGASEKDFEDAEPLLHLWGSPERVRRVGDVGAGSATKLCLNLGLGFVVCGIGEALRLAQAQGLDRDVVLDLLAMGPLGATVGAKRDMLDAQDYRATQFSLDLLAKDLALAMQAGRGNLAVTSLIHQLSLEALDEHAGEDYAALAAHLSLR